jgi:excisionase family DNA binding protein
VNSTKDKIAAAMKINTAGNGKAPGVEKPGYRAPMSPHNLTVFDVSQNLGVCARTVRRLVHRGELTAYRIGRDYRFTPSDVEIFLERSKINSRINR